MRSLQCLCDTIVYDLLKIIRILSSMHVLTDSVKDDDRCVNRITNDCQHAGNKGITYRNSGDRIECKNPDNLEQIVNDSITQTLTRSIYTSFTTFVMVAVLYILGVSSIREFAAPLMAGVICGAYSSVCITGALWLVMKRRQGKAVAQAALAGKTAGSSKSSAKQPTNTAQNNQPSKKDKNQPKKKNRKRVAERLAAQEAAAKEAADNENKTE